MKKLILILIAQAALTSIFLFGCSDLSDWSIKQKCLGGHVYYFNDGYNQGGIAPKLTDEGKPVHCEEME